MANDLYGDGVGEVLSALDSATLPADVEQLVLTALLAPSELSSDAALNERVKRPMIEPDATDPSTALAPVYLNSISIRGFRGVDCGSLGDADVRRQREMERSQRGVARLVATPRCRGDGDCCQVCVRRNTRQYLGYSTNLQIYASGECSVGPS
jgi:hypothetical protein